MTDRQILFKTVHGSRLYGLNHAGSDEDFYTVVTKKPYLGKGQGKARYAKQTIVDNEDSMVVDFGTWVEMCKSGVPQALEAMFSNMATVDHIADFRSQFIASTGVYERYMRTIKSFAYSETDPVKRKRHALRLSLNLRSIMHTGRFDPTLTQFGIDLVDTWKHLDSDMVYTMAKKLADS